MILIPILCEFTVIRFGLQFVTRESFDSIRAVVFQKELNWDSALIRAMELKTIPNLSYNCFIRIRDRTHGTILIVRSVLLKVRRIIC